MSEFVRVNGVLKDGIGLDAENTSNMSQRRTVQESAFMLSMRVVGNSIAKIRQAVCDNGPRLPREIALHPAGRFVLQPLTIPFSIAMGNKLVNHFSKRRLAKKIIRRPSRLPFAARRRHCHH
jgi:hypothetical protein